MFLMGYIRNVKPFDFAAISKSIHVPLRFASCMIHFKQRPIIEQSSVFRVKTNARYFFIQLKKGIEIIVIFVGMDHILDSAIIVADKGFNLIIKINLVRNVSRQF